MEQYLLRGIPLSIALTATVGAYAQFPIGGTLPPGSSGHWRITVTPTGYTNFHMTNAGGISGTYPYPELGVWGDKDGEASWLPYWIDEGISVTVDGSGTYNIVADWVDGNGSPAPNPPQKLILKVSAHAGYMCPKWSWFANFENSISGFSANNGFNDPLSAYDGGQTFIQNRQGLHLLKLNGSSGHVQTSVDISASIACSVPFGGASGNMWIDHGVDAYQDNREASIFRPGAHDETVDSQGNLHGHTIFSVDDGTNPGRWSMCRFEPRWSGGWSMYPSPSWPHENIEVIWNGLDASYDYTPIYNFDYSNSGIYLLRHNPYYNAGTQELKLKLKDLGDGAEAEAVYYLTYHKPYENWVKTGEHLVKVGEEETVPVGQVVEPGKPYNLSAVYTKTYTSQDQVGADVSFKYPIKPQT
jgi:hypothetical protein